jgi:DNA polymerase III epsilon subunit-like protein
MTRIISTLPKLPEQKNKVMKPRLLVLDTEWTGLPVTPGPIGNMYSPHELWAYQSSRVIEIGWAVYDWKSGKMISSHSHLCLPQGKYEMNEKAQQMHGITRHMLENKGKKLEDVLDKLVRDMKTCKYLLGHNLASDTTVLHSEAHRVQHLQFITQLYHLKHLCSMQMYMVEVGLKRVSGLPKWPSLGELCEYANCVQSTDGESVEDVHSICNHRALPDALATASAFFKLNGNIKVR